MRFIAVVKLKKEVGTFSRRFLPGDMLSVMGPKNPVANSKIYCIAEDGKGTYMRYIDIFDSNVSEKVETTTV